MALGAAPRAILSMVVLRGLKSFSGGMVIGTAIALMLTRFMRSMLFGIRDTDQFTFVGVIVLLAVVAMVAIFVPALRATRVDPVSSLR
jgi:ABC-type antimicrobial peptide transport system permease subunit